MIRLSATTQSLQAILAGAITTSQLPVTVGYSDGTSAVYTGAAQLTLTNSAVAVTVCSAPAAGVVRDIDYIAVSNTDTAAATVTVRVNDNGTLYEQVKTTLQPGRQLVYTHASGWNVGPTDATPLPASPTASVGLVAVNGTATTYMRSDAAPALSQAIVPTWTGAHTWSAAATFDNTVQINSNLTTTGNTVLGDATTDTLNVGNGGIVKDASGNVGIGTATPGSKLDVGDGTATNPIARINGGAAGVAAAQARVTGVASFFLAVNNSGADYFGIPTSSVGLGTTTSGNSVYLTSQSTARLGINSAGDLNFVNSRLYPATPAQASQSNCALCAGSGAPSNGNGVNGDIYFRSDGGALTTVYQKRAGAWVGIV
jgi:hypothetical protein